MIGGKINIAMPAPKDPIKYEEWKRKIVGIGRKHSEESKAKTRAKLLGRVFSDETRRKMSATRTGQKHSMESRRKQSESQKGSGNHQWRGGLTTINQQIRKSLQYRLWREAVFMRDKWKCVWCGAKGDMHADHIKPFSLFPELRFAIDNGRTLCVPCHKKTDTYCGRVNKKRQ